MRTLVVEDDFMSRLLLQRLLKPFGESDVAVNGKEAIVAFRLALQENDPYKLVTLDIMMPEMDGQTVLKELRSMEAERGIGGLDGAKIVMTTALHDSKNIIQAFKSQCDGYLVKPIDRRKLVDQLQSLGLID